MMQIGVRNRRGGEGGEEAPQGNPARLPKGGGSVGRGPWDAGHSRYANTTCS